MGFPILVRWHLYIDSAPWLYLNKIKKIVTEFALQYSTCWEWYGVDLSDRPLSAWIVINADDVSKLQLVQIHSDNGPIQISGRTIICNNTRNVISGNSFKQWRGPWFNIKMSSYQYRKSHCGDNTVIKSSYLHNGNFYTGKMASLYWTNPLMLIGSKAIVWNFDD